MKKRRNIYKYVEEILINKTLIVVGGGVWGVGF
jgi:hypothetical protein